MGSQTTIFTTDTYAASAASAVNYNAATVLKVGSGRESFAFWSRSFPLRSTIISAKLRLYLSAAAAAGSKTVTVQRTSAAWSGSTLKWTNKPGVTGATASVVTTVTAVGSMVEIDITTMMQTIADSNGTSWWGVKVSSASAFTFHSANSTNTALRPRVVISWQDRPNKPTTLKPAGGRIVSEGAPVVRCDFTDVSGDTKCAGIQVRTFTSEALAAANSTTPAWDSTELVATSPELDLDAAGYTNPGAGVVVWWIVRVQDGAGLWSLWSAPASFAYRALGTVTLTNPDTSGKIYDATPPVVWTFSGTQAAYLVRVEDVNGVQIGTTGKVVSADTTITLPSGWITTDGATYTVTVEAWDQYQREATPGAPATAVDSQTAVYDYDPTTDEPLTLTAAQQSGGVPSVDLAWTVTAMPDSFTILRGTEVIATGLVPADLLDAGVYRWTDVGAPPKTAHTYGVRNVVNGKASPSKTATVTVTVSAIWIIDPAAELSPVALVSLENEWGMGELSAWHEPIGSTRPVLITQGLRGFEGTVTGALVDVNSLAAGTMRTRLLAMRSRPGRTLRLILADYALTVALSNIWVSPVPAGDIPAGFSFRQIA